MRPELDDFNSCIHGIIPVGTVCSECEREEWASTCPKCGVGRADKLDRGYVCENDDCIKDHDGPVMWEVQGDSKTVFNPAPGLVTPGLLLNYLGKL